MSRSAFTHFALFRCLKLVAVVASILLPVASISAAVPEVQWYYDYNMARKAAQEKNRPLMLDFGTNDCIYCDRLDLTTFRDAAIVSLLNERFIPLKVHSPNNPVLTEQLRIHCWPTVILAAPDGKILGTLEGYMEASRFQEHLQRALASISNPEWMTRDYQKAQQAVAEGDYSRAIALLKNVLEDGKNRPIQVKAQQDLKGVEQLASQRLARSKQLMDKGQPTEAMETVMDLLRSFPGTSAAAEAEQMHKSLTNNTVVKAQLRASRARELLAQAKEDYRSGQYYSCIDRCDALAQNYPDLTEGGEAIQLAKEIKNNPVWLRQACETLSDRLSLLYLSLAETYLQKGQPKEAERYWELVIQTFPGTRQADAAQIRLMQLQGQPSTQQATFNRTKHP